MAKVQAGVYSAYRVHDPVDFECEGPSLTRQEFAQECDINDLMARYQKTGVISHVNKADGMYLDVSEVADLATAMQIVSDANDAFMQLPSAARAGFDNDPVKFVEFAGKAESLPKLREWGLAPPEKLPEPPVRVEVVSPPTAPAGSSSSS